MGLLFWGSYVLRNYTSGGIMRGIFSLFLIFVSVQVSAFDYYEYGSVTGATPETFCAKFGTSNSQCPPVFYEPSNGYCRVKQKLGGSCEPGGALQNILYVNTYGEDCPTEGDIWQPDFDGELELNTGSCVTPPPPFECPAGQVADTFTLGGTEFNTCAPPLEEPCFVLGYSGDETICAPPGEPELCIGAGGAYGMIDGVGKCVFGDPEQPLPPEIPECSSGYILIESGGNATCKKVFSLPPQLEDIDNPNSGGTSDGSGGTTGGSGGTGSADTDGDGIINVLDPDIDGDGILNNADPDIDGDGFNNDVDTDIDGDGVNNDRDNDIDGDGINNGADNDIDGDGVNNDTDTDDDGDGVSDGDDPVPGGNDGGEEGTDGEQSVSGGGNCDPASQPTCDGGEPILCAILVQNWRTQCALNEEVDFETEFADYIAENAPGNLYQPDEDLTSTLTGIFNQSAGDQSCPPGVPLNLLGTSFTFDYAPICDVADGIRPIMLVIFSLLGFRVLMRAFN